MRWHDSVVHLLGTMGNVGLLDKGCMSRIFQFTQSRDCCPTLGLRFQG